MVGARECLTSTFLRQDGKATVMRLRGAGDAAKEEAESEKEMGNKKYLAKVGADVGHNRIWRQQMCCCPRALLQQTSLGPTAPPRRTLSLR